MKIKKRNEIIVLSVITVIVAALVLFFSYGGFVQVGFKQTTGEIGPCPKDYCRDWIRGSCLNKKVYMERECYRYPPTGTPDECENNKEIYYEKKTQNVEACSQADCPAGATFISDEMRCEVLQSAATTCPEDYCLDWIYGSCSDNQQYMERECHKFSGPDCKEVIYYESKLVEVEQCP